MERGWDEGQREMSCPSLEPLSLVGTGAPAVAEEAGGRALDAPSVAPGLSWATSMALKDPRWGLAGLRAWKQGGRGTAFLSTSGLAEPGADGTGR